MILLFFYLLLLFLKILSLSPTTRGQLKLESSMTFINFDTSISNGSAQIVKDGSTLYLFPKRCIYCNLKFL